MTAPDNRNDAVQFLFKHGDLTFSAAHAAVEKLCNNGFRIVRADLAVPAQVRVKPLVWTGDGHWHSGDNEGWMEEANTPFGWGYAVEFGTLDTGPWKVSSTFGSDIVKFDTPSAAKAAAQADYEARILAAIEPQPAPRDEVIARLVEENNWQIKARAQHWLRRTISAPEDAAVEEICEKYGYGAVMDAASRLWARKPYGSGAFYVGGCIGFKSDDEARAALAAAKAVQHG